MKPSDGVFTRGKNRSNGKLQGAWPQVRDMVVVAVVLRAVQIVGPWISFAFTLWNLFEPKVDAEASENEEKQPEALSEAKKEAEVSEVKEEKVNGMLFPSISNSKIDNSSNTANPQLCSTGLTTRLRPFKNADGEIEWAFTDDVEENEFEEFKRGAQDFGVQGEPMMQGKKESTKEVHLSPTTSNSSNNESIISQEFKKKNKDETPMTSNSSPFSPGDENKKSDGETDDDSKTHQCPHCDAVFKIRGYLTRHLKKHALNKAYTCPFHKFSIYIDENNITHKCHPNGGFSRRDTYKTHLKSRHFKYPKGTKTKERPTCAGNCSMCGEYFDNAEIWCELHVEGGECKYLPVGFKGKSRIKNRIMKELNKQQKEMRNMPNISHKELLQATSYSSPFNATPTSHSNTPVQIPNMSYEYQRNTSSPTLSISSSIANQQIQNSTPCSSSSPNTQFNQTQTQTFTQYVPQVSQPYFEQFSSHKFNEAENQKSSGDDYDDAFCLDVDQLNPLPYDYNQLMHYMKMQQNGMPNYIQEGPQFQHNSHEIQY